MTERYPGYDVLGKWRSPSFDETTRQVLRARLDPPVRPRFLTPAEWRLVEALAARLVPQPDRAEPIPIAAEVDAMLADGIGIGYRRPGTPPLRENWRRGLAAIADEAALAGGGDFATLAPDEQDALLSRLQRGEGRSPRWDGPSAADFFADTLLRTVAGIYYSHPLAWNEIGFGGPASPRGYVRLGFDEHDPWEAHEG